jgi:hypothetical protein
MLSVVLLTMWKRRVLPALVVGNAVLALVSRARSRAGRLSAPPRLPAPKAALERKTKSRSRLRKSEAHRHSPHGPRWKLPRWQQARGVNDMARRADGSSRHATENAAGAGDDVDAGWDEAPRTLTSFPPPASVSRKVSAPHTPSPSLPPVARAPRPNPSGRAPRALSAPLSWLDRAAMLQEQLRVSERPSLSIRREPAPVREEPMLVREEPTLVREEPTLVREEPTLVREESTLVREEPTLVREEPTLVREEPTLVREEPTLEFRSEYLDEADIDAPEPDIVEQGSTELDTPNFRRHQLGPAHVITAIAAALALVVVSVVRDQFASHAQGSAEIRAPRLPKEPVAQPPSETRAPEAPPVPAIPPVPLATSLEQGSNTVAVSVKVIPSQAVIFRAGKKLGSGTIEVSVDPNAKQRLTALHDGYAPYNFTLDGSRNSVTVRLKPAPKPHAVAAPVSDSPFAGPGDDPNGANPRSAPAAIEPESPPRAAPAPDASAGETPAP